VAQGADEGGGVIDALVAGRIFGTPAERTSKNGNKFATAKVRVAVRESSLFVNVIAFSSTAVTALLALGDGDSVSLSGELTAKTYVDKDNNPQPSLDLLAHAVLSPYDVKHRRAASSSSTKPDRDAGSQPQEPRPTANGAPFNDPILF
jgi:single-stranded DNA-binding protein